MEEEIKTKAFLKFLSTSKKKKRLLKQPWKNPMASIVSCSSPLNAESNTDEIIKLIYNPESRKSLAGRFMTFSVPETKKHLEANRLGRRKEFMDGMSVIKLKI